MAKRCFSVLGVLIVTSLVAGIPAGYAQAAPANFTGEPDKTMVAAHESFVKKRHEQGSRTDRQGGNYVKKEAAKSPRVPKRA